MALATGGRARHFRFMPLSITKIAFGSSGPEDLRRGLEAHAAEGEVRLTTRYLPKRAGDMVGGSLYWIHGGRIVGRSPLLGFEEKADGRYWLRIAPCLIDVMPQAKRPHQGWRYLEEKDAPADLGGGAAGGDALPAALAQELERLGLL